MAMSPIPAQSMFRPLRAVRSLADVEAIESQPMAGLITAQTVYDLFCNSAREHGQGQGQVARQHVPAGSADLAAAARRLGARVALVAQAEHGVEPEPAGQADEDDGGDDDDRAGGIEAGREESRSCRHAPTVPASGPGLKPALGCHRRLAGA